MHGYEIDRLLYIFIYCKFNVMLYEQGYKANRRCKLHALGQIFAKVWAPRFNVFFYQKMSGYSTYLATYTDNELHSYYNTLHN